MERLTQRHFDGSGVSVEGATWEAFEKLAAYEDAEESGQWVALPPKTQDVDFMRIFELITADGEGRAIILPCKVGDTVWTNLAWSGWHFRESKKPYVAKVVFIGLNDSEKMGGGVINVSYNKGHMMQFSFSDIGKTVFLTREEAEAALKGEKTDG